MTLQCGPRTGGYFAAKRFQHRTGSEIIHEIALNPDSFVGRTDEQILDTLVHEMAHVWQQTYGKPGRRGYHNKQWAAEMKRIGLYPSDTGQPGGKETGEGMSDYIIEGGRFQVACRKLLARGFKLDWQGRSQDEPKKWGRIKYSCPNCGLNAWGEAGDQHTLRRVFQRR
jgi:predicted SprT family Zn-dependent metalloprotease